MHVMILIYMKTTLLSCLQKYCGPPCGDFWEHNLNSSYYDGSNIKGQHPGQCKVLISVNAKKVQHKICKQERNRGKTMVQNEGKMDPLTTSTWQYFPNKPQQLWLFPVAHTGVLNIVYTL